MTTNLQQGTLLDVLKKKMRQTKEEMERYKDECEEYNRKHQLEAMRREEVSDLSPFIPFANELRHKLPSPDPDLPDRISQKKKTVSGKT
jgi:predicted RNase H-like nuclease (RuvC/YqgF family)